MVRIQKYRHGGFSIFVKKGEKIADISAINLGMPVGKCPKCNENLVIRNGKHGKFIGCTGFKDGCRNTYSLESFRAVDDFEIMGTRSRRSFEMSYLLLGL